MTNKMPDLRIGREPQAQLSTAKYLLAQFIAQTDEYDGMNRAQKRTARGRELASRIDGLREGRAKWETRVAELQRIIAEDAEQEEGESA